MAQYFTDRPVFAWVIALFILVAGGLAITQLPIAQYPPIAPPSVVINATYPGASAATIDESITSIVEQELNGAEGLLYVESTSQSNGTASINASFQPGTNPDLAAVDVQNRLQRITARLPQAVVEQGLQVVRSSTNFLMVVSLVSRNASLDPVVLGDYASRNVLNEIRRIPGVGAAQLFGSERAMRVWIDPARLEGLRLGVTDVTNAIRSQNLQVAGGAIGELPDPSLQPIAASIVVSGQLASPEAFGNLPVRASPDGSVVRLRDVARVELGAQSYATSSRINGQTAAGIGVQLAPTGNALETAEAIRTRMDELSRFFPAGVEYRIPYDSSRFVRLSIEEVVKTLFEAIALVFVVMLVFLQNFRATLIPTIVVPVALTGAFATMYALGFSINVLTMFGLVLAIGIVVDDAIVVIENVERIMREEGLPPREATHKAMRQITGAVVGMTLVLIAVFIPMAAFGGAVGAIYRQFSIAVSSAIAFSALMALTLTPALCASFLKPIPKGHHLHETGLAGWFNRRFDRTTEAYGSTVARLLRRPGRTLAVYLAVAVAAALVFMRLPTAFLPNEDQGFVLTSIQLPAGASANRTIDVIRQVEEFYLQQPAVASMVSVAGFSFAGSGPNAGIAFVTLRPWDEREESADAFVGRAFGTFASTIRDAIVYPLNPPPIPQLGTAAGISFRLQDRAGLGHERLLQARNQLLGLAGRSSIVTGLRPEALEDAPQIELVVDRLKAAAQGVSMADVGTVLSTALGSAYVADFPNQGRQQRVLVQAEAQHRMQPSDIGALSVRNARGEMVPLSSVSEIRWIRGPVQLVRYNGYPAIRISGQAAPGYSTGDAMTEVERMVAQLPQGTGLEWSGTSFQERLSGAQAPLLYALSLLAVFLCLAALYESWSTPVAVLLVVPLGVLGTALFTGARGLENDVYFKVGMLAVMGLSAKNAILIVEFARELHAQRRSALESAVQAARLRFRPILMTSFAFMLGVLPLVVASGASSASQRAIGTAVFGGMVTGTALAVLFVPVFFVAVAVVVDRWREIDVRRLGRVSRGPRSRETKRGGPA